MSARIAARWCFLIVLLTTSAAGWLSVGRAQDDTSSPRRLGIVEGYWRPQATADLNVQWERITFDWSLIQPNGPGDFNVDYLRNEWFDLAVQADRQVVGLIMNTPQWASRSGVPSAVPDGLYASPDSPENLWAVFLRQLITAFAGHGIHHWIIWDTPDIAPGDHSDDDVTFEGSVEDYYRLIKIAWLTIKELDPEAVVLIGGLSWWHDIAYQRELYLKRLLEVVLGDPDAPSNGYFFDGVTLNILLSGNPIGGVIMTSDMAGDIPFEVRTILDEVGLAQKQIWVTALGASPTRDPVNGVPNAPVDITLAQQADFIVQGMVLALAAGADRVGVYKLFDSNFTEGESVPYGLLRADNSFRPAYNAYQSISRLLSDSVTVSADRSQNGRLVTVEKVNQTLYIMWSFGTQAVNFWVGTDFDDEVVLYNALGDVLPSPRIGVGVNEETVYVIETPAATAAQDGVVRVSGSPRILVLNGPPRPVWAAIDSTAVQLR